MAPDNHHRLNKYPAQKAQLFQLYNDVKSFYQMIKRKGDVQMMTGGVIESVPEKKRLCIKTPLNFATGWSQAS